MSDDKISMPSTQAGLTRYFDDYKSKIQFKPQHILILAVIIILIEVFLHSKVSALLGIV